MKFRLPRGWYPTPASVTCKAPAPKVLDREEQFINTEEP